MDESIEECQWFIISVFSQFCCCCCFRNNRLLAGFLCDSNSKESGYNAGYPGSTPGSERCPGEVMATHPSILPWRILWTEESGGLQSMGSQRVRNDWATNTQAFSHFFLLLKIIISSCYTLFLFESHNWQSFLFFLRYCANAKAKEVFTCLQLRVGGSAPRDNLLSLWCLQGIWHHSFWSGYFLPY